jgi:hypothetical protein
MVDLMGQHRRVALALPNLVKVTNCMGRRR